MKRQTSFKKKRLTALIISAAILLTCIFGSHLLYVFSYAAIKSAAMCFPYFSRSKSQTAFADGELEDIHKLMREAQANSKNDKKDGDIKEKTYLSDGETDKIGSVRIRNTNKTKPNFEEILNSKIDLSVNKDEPSVLIFHTHTTESYQILDRDFYACGFIPRSNDSAKNMVRVGNEICAEIEKGGFKVIHDTEIHDRVYGEAYENSRNSVQQYLKKYPSIKVILDIHRDAVTDEKGTKTKPVADIDGKKVAQIMIISGCQEDGNGIENFPDWKENLVFACALQKTLEEKYPTITRPLFFCGRKYNMNLSHTSLLIEIGSEANTLEQACLSGKYLGASVCEILEQYMEQ